MENHPDGARLADAIGSIYESTIDPSTWPQALRSMSGLVDAFFSSIVVLDHSTSSIQVHSRWGGDTMWIDLLDRKYAGMMPFLPVLDRFGVGQPFNMTMAADLLADPAVWHGEFTTEWAQPAGVRDSASVILERTRSRSVALTLSTHRSRPVVSEAELRVVELLVPHIQRALRISEVMAAGNRAADTFERMLDTLQTGAIAVDGQGRVRHANHIASAMLSRGDPVFVRNGTLAVRGMPASTDMLVDALSRLGRAGAGFTGSLPGLPLRFEDGRSAVGHILPLGPERRSRGSGSGAIAAIFIATASDRPHVSLEALTGLYGLTGAESRVLAEIAAGRNRAEAARALSIADSTAKTHLERVFWKTGTSTQLELVRLVSNLSVPMMKPDS